MSVSAARECQISAAFCGTPNRSRVWDSSGKELTPADGTLLFSPNGRWALGTSPRLSSPFASHDLVDIANGATYAFRADNAISTGRDWRRHGVSNDGTAVLALGIHDDFRIATFRAPDRVRVLQQRADAVSISADGGTMVWSRNGVLWTAPPDAADTAARTVTTASPATTARRTFWLSDDGRRILFLSAGAGSTIQQAFIVNTDGSGKRQLTSLPGGVRDAILAGSGRVAFVVDDRSERVHRLDLASGADEVWLSIVAWIRAPEKRITAGQLVRLTGTFAPPDAVSFTNGGNKVPVFGVDHQSALIQIPWSPTSGVITTTPADPVWTSEWPVVSSGYAAELLMIAKQDYSAFVTRDNPARPGDIVHIYATGLGPLVTTPVTGQPNPSASLATTIRCFYAGPHTPVEILHAGLAPGAYGFYQLKLRLPRTTGIVDPVLVCTLGADSGGVAYITLPLVN